MAADLGDRLTGSALQFDHSGRPATASVNLVTAHDGFTLRDLVSYERKHNEANGEDNRDGEDHNRSFNCGIEGPTDDSAVNILRARQQRNFLATLLLSHGVPMLVGGDEVGRSQQGNNNAYCQDNALSWFNWDIGGEQAGLADFVRRLVRLRLTHPLFHRRRYFEGRPVKGTGMKDAFWVTPQGVEMDDNAWHDRQARTIGMVLIGETIDETDRYGRRLGDDNFLLLLNAAADDVAFVLPSLATSGPWECVLDTAQDGGLRPEGRYQAGEPYPLTERSLALLRQSNRRRRTGR
jgi:glycogen operon protein